MIVTEIKPVTRKRSWVSVEGQPAFVLYNGELSRYRIREGEELPQSVWRELMEEVLVKRSRKRALNLLLKSDRTRSQLLQKLLTDGYPPEIAEQAVAYAESFGYIDDSRYARRYLDGPGGRKSRTAARVDLIRKGISSDLVDRILQETEAESEETEREKAVSLVRKRVGEPHRLDDKEYRRTYAYLARRGFSSSDICFALDEYKTKEF